MLRDTLPAIVAAHRTPEGHELAARTAGPTVTVGTSMLRGLQLAAQADDPAGEPFEWSAIAERSEEAKLSPKAIRRALRVLCALGVFAPLMLGVRPGDEGYYRVAWCGAAAPEPGRATVITSLTAATTYLVRADGTAVGPAGAASVRRASGGGAWEQHLILHSPEGQRLDLHYVRLALLVGPPAFDVPPALYGRRQLWWGTVLDPWGEGDPWAA